MNQLVITESCQGSSIHALLDALGIRLIESILDRIPAGDAQGNALLLSEKDLIRVAGAGHQKGRSLSELLPGFSQILIYPFSGSPEGLEALQRVVGGLIAIAPASANRKTDYLVTKDRAACGPFAGLRVEQVDCEGDLALKVESPEIASESLVSNDRGSVLTKFSLPGAELFVLSSGAVFDVHAEHLKNLDIRECFSGLVPLLFFLRHCRIDLPVVPMQWAHWIIDDPNLRPRYGFLDLKALARCVQETGVAASIAFIPWNHRRTSKEIVDLFRKNWPRLSVCVHGCDHTGSEFSTRSMAEATPLIDLAMERMKRLEVDTSLGFERVMVFPQGRFSGEAMRALRASEMVAAVNTELLDCQTGSGVKGAELLKPVITSFGGFPLFMRRPAEESAPNFALDLMLGKPALIVTHHQYFEHGLTSLRTAVEMLNALEPNLTWSNLERGIASTYSVSRDSRNKARLRLYGSRTEFVPAADEFLTVSKAETDPDSVEVYVDGKRLAASAVNGDVQFAVSAAGKKAMVIEARAAVPPRPLPRQSRKYRLKVTARRYLTEVRDNYLSRFPRLTARATSLQQLLRAR